MKLREATGAGLREVRNLSDRRSGRLQLGIIQGSYVNYGAGLRVEAIVRLHIWKSTLWEPTRTRQEDTGAGLLVEGIG